MKLQKIEKDIYTGLRKAEYILTLNNGENILLVKEDHPCKNCGAIVLLEKKICNYCGSKI